MSESSPPFWVMVPSLEAIRTVSELMDKAPPAFDVKSAAEPSPELISFWNSRQIDESTGIMPRVPSNLYDEPLKLTILDSTFNQDYIAQGGPFCSRKMRDLFDLAPSSVQYFPVDCSGSFPEVRHKQYMLMHVLAFESVIDLDKSDVLRLPADEFGRPAPWRVVGVKSVTFKDNAVSRFPLFRDPNDERLYATDEFACRVLSSGNPDVAFLDISSEYAKSGNVIFKELR